MSIFIGKMRNIVFASLLGVSAVAVACELITLPPPPTITIPFSVWIKGGAAIHKYVGDKLQSIYGNAHNANEVFINNVTYKIGLNASIGTFPFTKPCDQTFKEAGEDYNAGIVRINAYPAPESSGPGLAGYLDAGHNIPFTWSGTIRYVGLTGNVNVGPFIPTP